MGPLAQTFQYRFLDNLEYPSRFFSFMADRGYAMPFNLKQIQEHFRNSDIKSRLAPSPSGNLHLGHVLHTIYVWGITKALQGELFIRMEDHDRQRSKDSFIQAILKELNWLGISALPKTKTLEKQSDYLTLYADIFSDLKNRNLVYPCSCTRKELLQRCYSKEFKTIIYDGRCRHQQKEVANPSWRLRVDSEKSHPFLNFIHGENTTTSAATRGDFPLVDRKDNFTYQFAVVVDDIRQKISLVIRGEDLLASTGRYLYLWHLLQKTYFSQNRQQPVFLHHPLLYEEEGSSTKLSKRFLSESVTQLQAQGLSQNAVLGMAAFKSGLIPANKPISLEEVAALWDKPLS